MFTIGHIGSAPTALPATTLAERVIG